MAFVNDSDSPVLDARGNDAAPCFRLPENIRDFFRRRVGGKIPVLGLFPAQHIPHRASDQANLSASGVKQRGDFFKYRVNDYQSRKIIALHIDFLYTGNREEDLTRRRGGAEEENRIIVSRLDLLL